MVAVAIIGSAVVGAGATAISSHSAAKTQADAANNASAQQRAMYDQTRSDLSPFRSAGMDATNQLTSRLGDLTSPFSMSQADLEKTPGYQFNLSQGLKATNNALGARGLLNSGAVMKGASSFATGLADSTYMDQFNMDQMNKANAYNKLMGAAQLGENAAAQTGAYGTQTASQIGQNTIGAGNAIAAGQIATGNAFANVGNSLGQAAMFNKLTGAGSGGIFGGSSGSFGGGPLSGSGTGYNPIRAAASSYGGQG